ncbi:MAG: AraC family transcriptional regulator ligand-binding domain-containing protein [Pseudomonadota bacterium]
MDSEHGVIRAILLVNFVGQVRHICVNDDQRRDVDGLLRNVGITTDDLSDGVGFVSLRKVFALLEACSIYFDDPWFGVRMARGLPVGGTGLLGLLVFNSPNGREAIHQLAACAPIFIRPMNSGFREAAGVGTLHWSFRSTGARLGDDFQFCQFIAAITILRFKQKTQQDFPQIKVRFEHKEIEVRDDVAELIGSRVEFGAEENSLSLSLSLLDRDMVGADPNLYIVLKDLARRWLAEARIESDIVAMTRSEIVLRLKSGAADLDHTAEGMRMSPRLLQSRLEQAGTNFEKVLSETRSEIALRLLRDTNRPVSQIAYDLGYSDPSVLTRAVRRWFAKSPREVRQSGISNRTRH